MKKYDVMIIGGGPAGLATAIVAGRNGLKTLLVEKRIFPIEKACGEGVMPTGWDHLQKLGIHLHQFEQQYSPFAGIRYISHHGTQAQANFREGNGVAVQRTVLSQALFEVVKGLPSVEIQENTQATLMEEEHCFCVQIKKIKYYASLIIGADGLHSKLRRQAGLYDKKKSLHRWGIRQHFAIAPWTNLVEVSWKEGIEAYVTPLSEHSIGVAFLWDRGKIEPSREDSTYQSCLQHFPELQKRLTAHLALDEPKAIGPLQQKVKSPTKKNLVLIGDAAGYLDALTGEGISLAMEQALLIERVLIPALKQEKNLSLALMEYRKAYQKSVQRYYQVTWLLLTLRKFPSIAESVVYVMNKQTDIFQHFLSANMGVVSPWKLSISQILRFVYSLLMYPLRRNQE